MRDFALNVHLYFADFIDFFLFVNSREILLFTAQLIGTQTFTYTHTNKNVAASDLQAADFSIVFVAVAFVGVAMCTSRWRSRALSSVKWVSKREYSLC